MFTLLRQALPLNMSESRDFGTYPPHICEKHTYSAELFKTFGLVELNNVIYL